MRKGSASRRLMADGSGVADVLVDRKKRARIERGSIACMYVCMMEQQWRGIYPCGLFRGVG